MTDLIKRLRGLEVTVCHEAADEIERLHHDRCARQAKIDRLEGVVNLAAEAIIACERACWHEGQTIPALNTEIRRIVGKFIKTAKEQGLDFESGAYGSISAPEEPSDG